MLFSIVIPVWNATEYLQQCVQSVLDQSHQDFEVILIDDGSTDDSWGLCQKLERENPGHVRALHQENAGTSAARNAAVAQAQGDYLLFMDNDDFLIEKDALSRIAARITENNPDLVMYASRIYHQDTDTFGPLKDDEGVAEIADGHDRADALRAVINKGLLTRAVWTKATRMELIRAHNIQFPVGKRNEDTDWSAYVLEHAARISWCTGVHYGYRKGNDNAQTSKPISEKMVRDLGDIICKHMDYLAQAGLPEEDLHAIYAYLAYPWMVWCGQSAALHIDGPGTPLYQRMKSFGPALMRQGYDPGVRMASRAFRILGMRPTRWLLGIAFRRMYPNAVA